MGLQFAQVSVPVPITEKPDCGVFIAGGTRLRLNVWKAVTHGPIILGYSQGVRIDFNSWPEQVPTEFRDSEKSITPPDGFS